MYDKMKMALLNGFLVVLGGLFLYPLVLLLSSSLKQQGQVFVNPMSLPNNPTVQALFEAWSRGLGVNLLNSTIVVVTSIILMVACGSLAAYAFVRFDFSYRYPLLVVFVAGLMIPPQVLLVPIYSIMNALNLLNTFWSLILTYVGFSLPFSIFLIYQFFTNIPSSYADAAQIDGCSEFQTFIHVYLPLSVPAVSAVAVFQFVWLWNEFIFALTFIVRNQKLTLAPAIVNFSSRYAGSYTVMFAGVVIAIAPSVLLFLIFQKQFIRGITFSSLKG